MSVFSSVILSLEPVKSPLVWSGVLIFPRTVMRLRWELYPLNSSQIISSINVDLILSIFFCISSYVIRARSPSPTVMGSPDAPVLSPHPTGRLSEYLHRILSYEYRIHHRWWVFWVRLGTFIQRVEMKRNLEYDHEGQHTCLTLWSSLLSTVLRKTGQKNPCLHFPLHSSQVDLFVTFLRVLSVNQVRM